MRLTYDITGNEVKVGDVVPQGAGAPFTVKFFRPPHKPSSSGKVTVTWRDKDSKEHTQEVYAGCIGATWIEREDRNPHAQMFADMRAQLQGMQDSGAELLPKRVGECLNNTMQRLQFGGLDRQPLQYLLLEAVLGASEKALEEMRARGVLEDTDNLLKMIQANFAKATDTSLPSPIILPK